MQKKRRKAGLILMSLLLAFTSLPVSATESNEASENNGPDAAVFKESDLQQEQPENGLKDETADNTQGDVPDEAADDEPKDDGPSGTLKDNPQDKVPDDGKDKDSEPAEPVVSEEYDLSSDEVEVRLKDGKTDYVYTGSEIKPEIEAVVKPKESASEEQEKIIDEKYYTVEYQDNINAGEALVTIKGKDEKKDDQDTKAESEEEKKGICTGVKSVKFKITQADINKCTLQAPQRCDYTGKKVKPEVTLTYEGKTLVSGKDYKLAYTNNKKIGTASLKISGIGNFKGERAVNFKITFGIPAVKATSSYSKITLKWQKIKDASGYIVYRSTSRSGKFKKVYTCKTGSKVSYSDTKAKFGKTYYYKVRAYKKVKVKVKKKVRTKQENGKCCSAVSIKKKLSTVKISSAKCASETTAKLVWKKITGAQGYEIYKSETKNGTYAYAGKVSSGGKVSYTAKKLKPGVAYYFKVKAFRKSGSKKYYGDFSAAKKETFTDGQRLYQLFPEGVPTTKAEMEQYLVTITVPIKDVNGVPGTKQLRVHKALTKEFMGAFQDMYAIGFPVRAEDTDTYNWRSMASGKNRSHHSYGCVVDLNWNSNPMIGVTEGKYKPGIDPYSVTPEVVAIWKKHGFFWGGDWTSSKDYMHFSYTNH